MESLYKAIVPLFYFNISQIIVRKRIENKIIEYNGKNKEKIRKGIEIVENIRIRRISARERKSIKLARAIIKYLRELHESFQQDHSLGYFSIRYFNSRCRLDYNSCSEFN